MTTRTKKPELEDYGITLRQYNAYLNSSNSSSIWGVLGWPLGFIVLTPMLVIAVMAREWGAVGFVGFICCGLAWVSVETAMPMLMKSVFLRGDVVSRIRLYENDSESYRVVQAEVEVARQETVRVRQEAERAQQKAERARLRKLRDFWMSLSGPEFEQELGAQYRQLGYQVEYTPTSGDEGVDLVLRKDGRTTVVQCKSYKYPVGPATARELYGSLMHFGADSAILACTGGFTSGVLDFVKGKPIELVSSVELALMADGSENAIANEEQAYVDSSPTCPRCRRKMRLQSGRYGKFWGCTGYPQCIETRQVWKF